MGIEPASFASIERLAQSLPAPRFSNGAEISMAALFRKAQCLVPSVDTVNALSNTLVSGRILTEEQRRIVEADPISLLFLLRMTGQSISADETLAPCTLQEALLCAPEKTLLSTLAAADGLRHQSLVTSAESITLKNSIGTGICARLLATYVCDTDPEAAFTAGVALYFGRLVLSIFLPHSYAELMATSSLTNTPLHLLEYAWLGFDGSALAEHILTDFKANDRLCITAGMQHLERAINIPQDCSSLLALCQTGSLLAQQILAGELLPRRGKAIENKFPLLNLLGMNAKEFLRIGNECRWAMFERHLLGE